MHALTCICPTVCDCENPEPADGPALVSHECPIHNLYPRPAPDCPLHGKSPSTFGPCAKAVVRCTIITPAGERIVGENICRNPQAVCPRQPGEDYTKCKTVCQQLGHAEHVALVLAGEKARGARAIVEGHDHACADCAVQLLRAGVRSFTVGQPQ